MKVLVLGGAGYIGGAVTDALLEKHIPFTVYDNLLYEPHYLKNVDFIRGDVRDTAKLQPILEGYSHVIFLAAIVGDGACAVTPDLTRQVNLGAVGWLTQNYGGRILFTSTCSVYGEHHDLLTEDGATKPLSLYAETKLDAERFLEKENALIFRLGTAFGLSDSYSRPRMDLVCNQMSVAALVRGAITVNGGDQWRPFVHVKDIAAALVNNLDRPVRGVYNLASENCRISALAETVVRLTGCSATYLTLGGDFRDYRVSTAKAVRDGIFNPSTMHTIEDGVREFTHLVRSGRVKSTDSEQYFNVRHVGELKKHGQFI